MNSEREQRRWRLIVAVAMTGMLWAAFWIVNTWHEHKVMVWPAEVCERASVEAEEAEWRVTE